MAILRNTTLFKGNSQSQLLKIHIFFGDSIEKC